MRLVIQLSRSNAEHGPGEPFGAGVLDLETNRLITPGVNLVTTSNLSAAHAEIVAIMVAQQVVRLFDLGGPGHSPYELVASTEPCAQCFGSVPWPGVRRLVRALDRIASRPANAGAGAERGADRRAFADGGREARQGSLSARRKLFWKGDHCDDRRA